MEREKQIYRVTVLGGVINVALLIFKFAAGFLAHSSAMLADAVHSFSDFITDVTVLVFVHISGKPQDDSHDYGHGKYETLATTLIGAALLAAAVGIFLAGVKKVVFWARGGTLQSPGALALVAAVVSIILKEFIYRYTVRKGTSLNSQALIANAWHHRSDALSSVGTAAGIGGAVLLGERWSVLDALASVVVGVFIVRISLKLIKDGIGELMESSLPEAVEKEILDIITSYPDVAQPHNLRTRRIGNDYAIEVHIRMKGSISLKDAHDRATDIENDLKERFGPKTHVGIHVEPVE